MPSCPSCGKGVAASAKTCGACGKPIEAAPAKADHSYDLMPEEPKKDEPAPARATAFDGAIADAAVAAKPGEILRPKIQLREDSRPAENPFELTKGTIAAGIVVALALVLFLFKACRTEYKLEGRWKQLPMEQTIGKERWKVENFVVKGGATYVYEITAVDGDLSVGVIRREPKASINMAALKSAAPPEGYTPVPKGESRTLEGKLKPGTYSWIVLNETPKPVKAKFKFLAAIPK